MSNYVIYGTPVCGYCRQAKSLLENKGETFIYVDLGDVDGAEQDRLMEVAGVQFRSVPQIFWKNDEGQEVYIGGYTELNRTINEATFLTEG